MKHRRQQLLILAETSIIRSLIILCEQIYKLVWQFAKNSCTESGEINIFIGTPFDAVHGPGPGQSFSKEDN